MNCQEFRDTWLIDTDSDSLSHIETCEACIAWIEAQANDEEVQFLKEVPMPPANLEERIMQAIYQTSEQGAPPHAATIPLQPAAVLPMQKKGSQRPKGFPSLAWVSAAAVLIAVGVVGYQQMQIPMVETAYEVGITQSDEIQSAASSAAAPQAPASSPVAPAAAPELNNQAESTATAETAAQDAPSPEATTAMGPAAVQPKTTVEPKQEAAPQAAGGAAATASTPRPVEKNTRPPIVDRNSAIKPPAEPTARKETPAVTQEMNATAAVAGTETQPSQEMGVAADTSNKAIYALTVAPEEEMATMDVSTAESARSLVGPPAPAETPITLSTFSDVETAVQASDMPVPVLSEVPDSFTLGGISIRYESETSQKVANVVADYQRDKGWIKVEVSRNLNGERSLSIPGTFTATQLFSVNNQQAIGVSYEQRPEQEQAAQHAVHFNAKSGEQSLYVVMTAHGVSLDELMNTAKKITWKP
jgi:hypothetical protein